MKQRQMPAMRLRNVQTNNIFVLTDREQIGKCLKQTFNSQVSCERFIDGQKKDDFIIRSIPRFEILNCDEELKDLIPKEEATLSIREKLLGKDAVKQPDTLEDLKKFCYEKGIHHAPNISYEKLFLRVQKWKEDTKAVAKVKKENSVSKEETKIIP